MFLSFSAGTGEGRPVSGAVMTSTASGTMRMPQTFDTSGTVREARGLASRTKTLPFSMAYCIFIRPTTCISSAILRVYSLMVARASALMWREGRMQAESPEWTPASSMCSITVGT